MDDLFFMCADCEFYGDCDTDRREDDPACEDLKPAPDMALAYLASFRWFGVEDEWIVRVPPGPQVSMCNTDVSWWFHTPTREMWRWVVEGLLDPVEGVQ